MEAQATSAAVQWHSTRLRIKDPAVSVPFYEKHFGMQLVHKVVLKSFTMYLMAVLEPGQEGPPAAPGTDAAGAWTFNTYKGQLLDLLHNHGTESQEGPVYHSGNTAPRGFGHIAFSVDDVYAACEQLEKGGVAFQKKPDDGRMKGLAFALDPDGYWIEILRGGCQHTSEKPFNLSQTMIRVNHLDETLAHYGRLGLTLINELIFDSARFSLHFLAPLTAEEKADWPSDVRSPEARERTRTLWKPVLELTHNFDPEDYHNGNTDPKGFAHVAFVVNDVPSFTDQLKAGGANVISFPAQGDYPEVAIVADPTGYWNLLYPRGWAPTAAQMGKE